MGEDRPQTSRQRVTVAQAAEILGVTVEAVRGRIKRGTLDHERTDKGVFVLLEADQPYDRLRPDTDQTADRLQSDSSALISAKDETIATLRDQLEAERQAHAEARRLLMAALERIPPQIEAPQETRELPQTVDEQQGRGHSPSPMLQALRRAYSATRGCIGCLEDERQGPENVEAHATANPDARNPSRVSVGSGA